MAGARTNPPFRAEHVGSLLRPPSLIEAFRGLKAGAIDADSFNDVLEDCIRDVVKLQDFTEGNFIEREMMFVKVKAQGESQRAEVKRLSDIFRARIIDVTDTTFCIELTGAGDKLDAYIKAMHENNIVEVVRSGSMGIMRGEKALTI